MPAVSTRRLDGPAATMADAIRQGLAPDGGLYVPTAIPAMAPGELEALRGRALSEVATALIAPIVADTFDEPTLAALMAAALDFPVPLVRLDDHLWVLELFHGPTLAFKDVGARTLARWLAAVSDPAGGRPLTILVATSGDTGGAVAQAFHRVAGTRVVVLYPRARVSRVQEAQFTTLGDNVSAVAIEGTFDDCQRLVKEAFADPVLGRIHRLTSANSINIGRLLPQMAYYAWAALQLRRAGPPPVMVVPSGNLGNLTAGVMASRRGVPVAGFVAPTTLNDPFPRYLSTGHFEPRPAVPTLASAMDVGHPSNLERLMWLFDGDLGRMRDAIVASAFADDDIRAGIGQLDARYGYVADPHTAVAYLGALRHCQNAAGPVVILATAHPAKFSEVVEPTLGRPVPMPTALSDRLAMASRAVRIPPRLDALTESLAHQ